jgi:hypothetical protein
MSVSVDVFADVYYFSEWYKAISVAIPNIPLLPEDFKR